ncbi:MAG: hypothetical protein HYZ48_05610, partial [Chlamydiales bacterium]|nr:hypothetical protein [Chlamydiales bacterium]
MNILLFLLALIPSFLQSSWEELFQEEDPTSFHHVNVITGHLNLSFQDTVVESAIPLSITRTYSSTGALEREAGNHDLLLKKIRKGWSIQGGWDLVP